VSPNLKDKAERDSRGWSYLFFLVAGMALIPIVIGYFTIPKDVKRLPGSGVDRRVDWIGGFLVTAGLSLFIFSLVQSGVVPRGWSEPCE
jgi:predicted MFS family arabinose efflux permease